MDWFPTSRDIRSFPTAWVRFEGPHCKETLLVGIALKLAYTVLLGQQWPEFQEILCECSYQPPGGGKEESVRRKLIGSPQTPTDTHPGTEYPMGNDQAELEHNEDFV